MYLFLVLAVALLLLGSCISFCVVPAQAEDGTVVFTVNKFGGPMQPVLPPYQNNPEAIVISSNMYSLQPGGRQLRHGTANLVDYLDVKDTVTAAVDALAHFVPTSDSGAIVVAAGGRWYRHFTGSRWVCDKFYCWTDTFTQIREIRPYSGASNDSLFLLEDSVVGVGTRFVRDVAPGDKLVRIVGTDTGTVELVLSDTKLRMASAWSANDTLLSDYAFSRSYTSAGDDVPFLLPSGNGLYTGNYVTDPQVIYPKEDNLFIRRMGIVDSFLIDSIYSIYPDSAPQWDSVSRRSWDTLQYPVSDSVIFVSEFQLVSRRKAWAHNEWLESVADVPESYYLRVGYEDKTSFYQIAGNSDTAIYCMAWFVDTIPLDSNNNDNDWNDSLYGGHGSDLSDIPAASDVVGTWGYIMSSAGISRTVVPDDSTGTVNILGRGAMFFTDDASFPIDSTAAYSDMLFIHLTGNDVNWNAYADSTSTHLYDYRLYRKADEPAPSVPTNDSLMETNDGWYFCYQISSKPSQGNFRLEPEQPYSSWCPATEYVYRTARTNIKTEQARAIGNSYFPVRYIEQNGDTLFFVTGVSSGLTSSDTAQTNSWEVVKVGMPQWAGMAEWNTPPQLVAWGDTASPSMLSFSGVNEPWNWSATNDVLVGNNTVDPIIACAGYDNQLVVGKHRSLLSYANGAFRELSQTVGVVGRRGMIGLNTELFLQDVGGTYMMDRRDLSGYSVKKISWPLDPIFNAWSITYYGGSVAWAKINQSYRYKSVLSYNHRDNHLYVFFPAGSATSNSHCLTYDVQQQQWDGYFDIAASDAIWGTVRDTARIIMGSPDSALIFGMDYAWNDYHKDTIAAQGTGIDAVLRSGYFWVPDEQGFPMESKLKQIRLHWRGAAASLDTAVVRLVGESGTDEFALTGSTIGDYTDVFRSSSDNISTYWYWEISTEGQDAQGNIFFPHQMQIEMIPVGKDD